MKTQNLIKQKLSQPESVVIVQQILEDNVDGPRTAIAERVCQHFGFFMIRSEHGWLGGLGFSCFQDGTDLSYNSLAQCEGLGVIGANQTGAQSRGLHLHSTLVVTTDGLPLGLLGAQRVAPEGKQEEPEEEEKANSSKKNIEEKKNFCWVESLRDSNALTTEMPSTHQVGVLDREADFFELFCELRRPQVDLLVRAKHNRRMNEEDKLFDTLR